MAVTVPKDDKVYTTIYDDFRGVDFTNDASNVWKHRSPTGKNMLPDLDGAPYKRKGWDIGITAQEFRDAAGADSSVEVIPDRIHYFSLGGYDYLMIFNNLGIFSYTANPLEESAESFPYLLTHIDTYIPSSGGEAQSFPPQVDGVDVPVDSGRAFFFEGGGTAGFYIFVGLKIFRYDGTFLREVEPHIPVVLIKTDSSGAGTMLEGINMLTDKRMVMYQCDGSSQFVIPGGVSGTPKVEVLNSSGTWVNATGYTISSGKIDFATPPVAPIEGEDALRITYIPDGVKAEAETRTGITTTHQVVGIERAITQVQGKWTSTGTPGAWSTVSSTYSKKPKKFSTPNIKTNRANKSKEITYQGVNTSGVWATLSPSYYTAAWNSYGNAVTMSPTPALFNSALPRVNSTASQKPRYLTEATWKKTNKTRKVNGKTQYLYQRNRYIYEYHEYKFRAVYNQYYYKKGVNAVNESKTAFSQCTRALVFGSGIINQVFMSTTPYQAYNTRIWYSAATDPTYFPELNYIEVGASDKPIMGMMKVGEYLGVIKQGSSFDTSIYLAYPTSFEEITTYAVKQNINGIGAVSNGAFNTLNEEPLFLSQNGVMGIEVSTEDTDRQLRSRSYYINKRLCSEPRLSDAVSFVHDGMYYLAVNNHCYVLDGSQKNSWANTKTNLQYECYYLDNVPAQCFTRFQDQLWFSDFRGNLCRFRSDEDAYPYRDAYSVDDVSLTSSVAPSEESYTDEHGITRTRFKFSLQTLSDTPEEGSVIRYGLTDYTVTAADDEYATAQMGIAIDAVWSTIADDDGAVHYFKNLKKKGCVISLLPSSDSGVKIYIKPDSREPYFAGETDAKDFELPYDFYSKKKIKKYKRLQFICENDVLDDSFGVDQIIKSYTMGNYSKNKR